LGDALSALPLSVSVASALRPRPQTDPHHPGTVSRRPADGRRNRARPSCRRRSVPVPGHAPTWASTRGTVHAP